MKGESVGEAVTPMKKRTQLTTQLRVITEFIHKDAMKLGCFFKM